MRTDVSNMCVVCSPCGQLMTQIYIEHFKKTTFVGIFFHTFGLNLSHVCHVTGTRSGSYGDFRTAKKIFKKMKKIQKVFKNGRFLRGSEQRF